MLNGAFDEKLIINFIWAASFSAKLGIQKVCS